MDLSAFTQVLFLTTGQGYSAPAEFDKFDYVDS